MTESSPRSTRPPLPGGLIDLAARAALVARFAIRSGLAATVTGPGLLELGRIAVRGAQNPALIYRIHGRNLASKLALVSGDEALTFGELDRRIDAAAAGLAARGIGRGQRVVLMLHNGAPLVVLSAAVARLGAAAVTVSWRSTASELRYLVDHSGARGLVFDASLADVVARAAIESSQLSALVSVDGAAPGATGYDDLLSTSPRRPREDEGGEDAAVIIYTSGTTGRPKGAVRQFPEEAMRAALSFLLETPLRTDDVHLVPCPLYHSTAYGFLTLSHLLGNSAVVMREFRPEPFLDLVAAHRVSSVAVVPTMLHRLLALGDARIDRCDTSSLRAVFSGGAPLGPALAERFMDRFGDVLFNFYGATETGLVSLASPADLRAAPGTIGRVLPGNEVRLLDERGQVVDGVGELFVRGPMQVSGYHADEAATRASSRDGFFSVGDLARRDEAGRLFLEGRKRDMIISGGVNVYPREVEDALEAHPAVAEAAVVGVADEEWGERVCAFVVAAPDATPDEAELIAWVRERLGGAKVPRMLRVVADLPRNATGKVLKRELRLRAEEASPRVS